MFDADAEQRRRGAPVRALQAGGLIVLAACAAGPAKRTAATPEAPVVVVAAVPAATPVPVAVQPAPAPEPAVAAPVAPAAEVATHEVREAPEAREETPPALRSSFTGVNIGYDAPAGEAEAPAAADGERPGLGAGIDRSGDLRVAHMAVPQLSLARPPRPKRDYTNLHISGASQFAGRAIRVELMIDAAGRVRQVKLLQGVDRRLDRRTVLMVQSFAYEPARDDDGMPIAGTAVWNINVVEDNEDPWREVQRLRN